LGRVEEKIQERWQKPQQPPVLVEACLHVPAAAATAPDVGLAANDPLSPFPFHGLPCHPCLGLAVQEAQHLIGLGQGAGS